MSRSDSAGAACMLASATGFGAAPGAGPGAGLAEEEALENEIALLSARFDAAAHRLLTCLRVYDAAGVWVNRGALSCAHWLSWRTNLDLGAAREKVRVARALGELPAVDEALRTGILSYAKVRALTRVATPSTESGLVETAIHTTAAQLEHLCRRYRRTLRAIDDDGSEDSPPDRSVRQRILPSGQVRLEVTLEPDEAALVVAAINRYQDHLRAERTCAAPPVCGATNADVRGEPADPDRRAPSTDGETSRPSGGSLRRPSGLASPDEGAMRATEADAVIELAQDCLSDRCDRSAPADIRQRRETRNESRSPGDVSCAPGNDAQSSRDDSPPQSCQPSQPIQSHSPGGAGSQSSYGDSQSSYRQSQRSDREFRRGDFRELVVHLEQDWLGAPGQFSGSLEDGTRVSAETFRRLACDTGIAIVLTDAAGTPLDVGRKTRSVPAALKRALWARDRGCRFPGCSHRRYVHAHHIHHWLHGGETSASNLLLLCSAHHRLLHEGGFDCHYDDSGALAFVDRDRREIAACPQPEAVSAEAALALVDESLLHQGVNVDATTGSSPSSWGEPIDYDWVLDSLIKAARS